MKHLFSLSLLLLVLLLPATALAHDFEVDGIYYLINGTEATVTSCPYPNKYTGNVAIPASVTYGGTTYSVTSIGEWAFADCSGLTSITIPNSVTTIDDEAFRGCSGLANIVVASGNPNYDSRNNCNAIIETASNALITGCMNTAIPNSVTSIGIGAFYGFTGLTSITIPNSVKTICIYAFFGCSGLTGIDIPNSVTFIGDAAFAGCSGLTGIDIPNSVEFIGDGAFSGCSGLTSVSIGNSVTYIGDYAFYDCSGLTSINIPNSVGYIGYAAFSDCIGLTNVSIGNSVQYIGYNAFFGCSITSVYITDLASWCSIYFSEDEFVYFSNPLMYAQHLYINGYEVKDLVIPNSVTSISRGAFYGCNFLTSVTIPNSVTEIDWYAFSGCSDLTTVSIGNSVTHIGLGAFASCHLNEVYNLALTPPTIDYSTFHEYYDDYNCYNEASLIVADITLEAYKAAEYWNEFTNIVGMPYTFEVDGTRYHATTLSTASVMADDEGTLYCGDVVIPDSVTYEGHTFAVTGIESNAFDGCFELTSITIPNSVESIGEQSFQGCTGLTSVTIGSGVTNIGAKAFNYCNALETVKCIGTVPPVMASADCFSTAAYNRATLLVPRNSEATYAAADYWYKFAHIEGWGSAGRGDIDGDGLVNIADVTFLIDAILRGDYEGVYFESADLNINGRLDIGDVTSLIDELLNGN